MGRNKIDNFLEKNSPSHKPIKEVQTIQQQNQYRQQFQELDKNKDYVIDSTEFIYRNN